MQQALQRAVEETGIPCVAETTSNGFVDIWPARLDRAGIDELMVVRGILCGFRGLCRRCLLQLLGLMKLQGRVKGGTTR